MEHDGENSEAQIYTEGHVLNRKDPNIRKSSSSYGLKTKKIRTNFC